MLENDKKVIINCHTHVFTGNHVPPYLAKSFLWWPFYFLLNTPLIMWAFRQWYRNEKWSPYFYPHKAWYKKCQAALYGYRSFIKRHAIIDFFVLLVNAALSILSLLYILLFLFNRVGSANGEIKKIVLFVTAWLDAHHLLLFYNSLLIKILIILFTFICISSGRKLIWMVLKKTWSVIGLLPDDTTIAFLKRYLNIGRFAYYKNSSDIFSRLAAQYDNSSGFVLLPMDMAYMGAGKPSAKGVFSEQMKELANIKKNHPDQAFPFVFIDPRRIEEDASFLQYTCDAVTGTVTLKDCFIKEFIEEKQFNGFKIYPALGYYPFDERLLILWKYAADHQVPILTHTIRGNIFYRGTKKKEWGRHPVFVQSKGRGDNTYEPLLLPELKNIDFINNFTHPLNFLCLVEEELLRKVVAKCGLEVQTFFGYTNNETPLKHNLKELKICFGHYGGDDEWDKFFEADRDTISGSLIREGSLGIRFLYNAKHEPIPGKIEQVWKKTDWYAIITSMMLQYPNLYADISYILHNETIIPLLKKTLQHPCLKLKVLFGTDFYVVRNHKSERQMLAEMRAALSEDEFDLIARDNPVAFLSINRQSPASSVPPLS